MEASLTLPTFPHTSSSSQADVRETLGKELKAWLQTRETEAAAWRTGGGSRKTRNSEEVLKSEGYRTAPPSPQGLFLPQLSSWAFRTPLSFGLVASLFPRGRGTQ